MNDISIATVLALMVNRADGRFGANNNLDVGRLLFLLYLFPRTKKENPNYFNSWIVPQINIMEIDRNICDTVARLLSVHVFIVHNDVVFLKAFEHWSKWE